jgi:hypothetical protein
MPRSGTSEGYGKESPHRTPQPGAEGNDEKNRERIELERGNDSFAQGGIGQQPNRSERADGDGRPM